MKEREDDRFSRRQFLAAATLAGGSLILPSASTAQNSMQMPTPVTTPTPPVQTGPANVTLRISTGLIELAPDHIVSTTLYNGQFPGPLLRFKEGEPVTIDIFNDTDTPELVHWHGQIIPTDVDDSAEEGTPNVPAHGMRRLTLTPKPAGFRFYHTHAVAGGDLNRGTYTGQAGPVYIEPKNDPGAYDR
jgi:FtsP/CotA-like multicopper oxidase with cupredoxin domain